MSERRFDFRRLMIDLGYDLTGYSYADENVQCNATANKRFFLCTHISDKKVYVPLPMMKMFKNKASINSKLYKKISVMELVDASNCIIPVENKPYMTYQNDMCSDMHYKSWTYKGSDYFGGKGFLARPNIQYSSADMLYVLVYGINESKHKSFMIDGVYLIVNPMVFTCNSDPMFSYIKTKIIPYCIKQTQCNIVVANTNYFFTCSTMSPNDGDNDSKYFNNIIHKSLNKINNSFLLT